MMICALSSVSNICILTIQDLIGLGSEARMNTPSVVGGNWTWRATTEEMDSISETKLKYFTELYGRKSTEHI
jgi:4-alpha-glucanotransferase